MLISMQIMGTGAASLHIEILKIPKQNLQFQNIISSTRRQRRRWHRHHQAHGVAVVLFHRCFRMNLKRLAAKARPLLLLVLDRLHHEESRLCLVSRAHSVLVHQPRHPPLPGGPRQTDRQTHTHTHNTKLLVLKNLGPRNTNWRRTRARRRKCGSGLGTTAAKVESRPHQNVQATNHRGGKRGKRGGGVAGRVSYPLRFSQTRSGTVTGLGAGIIFRPGKSDAAPYILVEIKLSPGPLSSFLSVRCRF
jgi:hypothetical protein